MPFSETVSGDIPGLAGIEFQFEVARGYELGREGLMSDGELEHKSDPARRLARPRRVGRWVAAALVLAVLAACQNGGLSYDPSTGLFRMPFGAESHKSGGD